MGTKLNKDIKDIPAVHIGNPKTLEFQVRTCTLPVSSLFESCIVEATKRSLIAVHELYYISPAP